MSELLIWVVSGSYIKLQNKNKQINLSASDIFKSEFKEIKEIKGLSIINKPSQDLKHIQFNRNPVNTILKLTLPNKSSKDAKITVVIESNNVIKEIPELPIHDHIVIENNWLPLISEDINKLNEYCQKLEIIPPSHISIKKTLELLKSNFELLTIDQNTIETDNKSIANEVNILNLLEQSNFDIKPYDYQIKGIEWMNSLYKERIGFILADEMGLGKTLQIIALITINKNKNGPTALIVSPATLLENWKREIKKFSPKLSVLIHSGADRTGFPNVLESYDIIVTSYDIAVSDQSMFRMITWGFLILDEAQAIKNPDTRRAQATKSLKRNIAIAVSGTPFENRFLDIWSLIDFSFHGYLGTRNEFESEFQNDEESAQKIEKLISPLILRRRVLDVATDLPKKIEIPQVINSDNDFDLEYENIRKETELEYSKSSNIVALIRLRQYCTHPLLVKKSQSFDPTKTSNKYLRMTEILSEIFSNNGKVLIFTSFTGMTDIMLSDLGIRFNKKAYSIDGRTPIGERQIIVDEFSKIADSAILILNPKAAGTGLNITAANYVIHYNPEWNPATVDQATARAYRRGQILPVFVYQLFYKSTIEEVMYERMQRKRDLSEIAIVGTNAINLDATDIAKALTLSPLRSKS